MTKEAPKTTHEPFYPILGFTPSSNSIIFDGLYKYRQDIGKLEDDVGGEKFITKKNISLPPPPQPTEDKDKEAQETSQPTEDKAGFEPGLSQHIMIFTDRKTEVQVPHIHPEKIKGSKWRILLALSNTPIIASQQDGGSVNEEGVIISPDIKRVEIPPYTIALYVVDGEATHWFGFEKITTGSEPNSVAVVASFHLIDPPETGAAPMKENTQISEWKELLLSDKGNSFISKISFNPPKTKEVAITDITQVNHLLEAIHDKLWRSAGIAYDEDGTPTKEGLIALAEILRTTALEALGFNFTFEREARDWLR